MCTPFKAYNSCLRKNAHHWDQTQALLGNCEVALIKVKTAETSASISMWCNVSNILYVEKYLPGLYALIRCSCKLLFSSIWRANKPSFEFQQKSLVLARNVWFWRGGPHLTIQPSKDMICPLPNMKHLTGTHPSSQHAIKETLHLKAWRLTNNARASARFSSLSHNNDLIRFTLYMSCTFSLLKTSRSTAM